MRAGNKRQRLVVYIDKSLPSMTLEQKRWAYKHTIDHMAVVNKGGRIACLDCGKTWQSTFKNSWKEVVCGQTCPRCNTELKVKESQKRKFDDWSYFITIETHKGFQVIRNFMIIARFKIKEKRHIYHQEISRIYIHEDGKYEVVGKYLQYSWSGDRWLGQLELRNRGAIDKHNINAKYVYHKRKVLPIIRRNGYKGGLHLISPFSLFYSILNEPVAETLFKTKQYSLLGHFVTSPNRIKQYWTTIKICIRNNYKVKEANDFLDYLGVLDWFNKDLHSTKYVCPENFWKEHDRYFEKKRRIEEARRLQKKREEVLENERSYKEMKKAFFKLMFKSDDLSVQVFNSVEQLMNESDALKHCAFGSNYHKRKNSLLFSARVKDKPIETVEVSLSNFKVLQARGRGNTPSKYNKEIVKLVEDNMHRVRMIANKKPKRKAVRKSA